LFVFGSCFHHQQSTLRQIESHLAPLLADAST
jgi:hypothetical protein